MVECLRACCGDDVTAQVWFLVENAVDAINASREVDKPTQP